MSQKRELEIEQELAAIMRELDRHAASEKPGPKKPAQVVQLRGRAAAPSLTSRRTVRA